MKSLAQTAAMRVTLWTMLVLLFTACSGRPQAATAAATSTPPPTEDLSGLSPEDSATLDSLEKVDDYPLYVMHYYGEYDYPRTGWTWPAGSDFSCSLFAALGEAGDMFFGRNFDWEFSPALLVFTDPRDGYASISMVDLTFLNVDPVTALSLTDLPLAERTALLAAPSMPFDGMNEYGLTIGMAAVSDTVSGDIGYDPSKPTIGSIGVIRQVLDHARSVDEAVAIFNQYNIDFAGRPRMHYLIADPGGTAVLVEFCEGEMILLPNEAPWHLATNHLRCIAEGDGGCERYGTLTERLAATSGELDPRTAMRLLSDVAQGLTQWSVVYGMTSGDVHVVVGRSYEAVFPFRLELVRP